MNSRNEMKNYFEIINHQMFHNCQRKIKKIQTESQSTTSGSQQMTVLGKNIQVSLAGKLQEISGVFRKTQSTYLSSM